jgi:hypothetical protein
MLKWLLNKILLIFNIFLSLFRIILYSKRITFCSNLLEIKNEVYIFGNGPSLKQVINDNLSFLIDKNLVVVNDFFFNEHFHTLKPQIYIIADSGYWEQNVTSEMKEIRQKLEDILLSVDWQLYFFVPTVAYNSGYYQQTVKRNSSIILLAYNTTSFIGPKIIRYYFYNALLAKPVSGNVIGSALYITLQMDIKNIFLFGVEHSWTKSLYVDEQNRTCTKVEHFYSNNETGQIWLKSNGEPYTIYEVLSDISKMLSGYPELNSYAESKNIRIYNCTPDSFIDAFERKRILR